MELQPGWPGWHWFLVVGWDIQQFVVLLQHLLHHHHHHPLTQVVPVERRPDHKNVPIKISVVNPDPYWIRIQELCGSGSVFPIRKTLSFCQISAVLFLLYLYLNLLYWMFWANSLNFILQLDSWILRSWIEIKFIHVSLNIQASDYPRKPTKPRRIFPPRSGV